MVVLSAKYRFLPGIKASTLRFHTELMRRITIPAVLVTSTLGTACTIIPITDSGQKSENSYEQTVHPPRKAVRLNSLIPSSTVPH